MCFVSLFIVNFFAYKFTPPRIFQIFGQKIRVGR